MTRALYFISIINKDPMRAFTGIFITWIVLQILLSFVFYDRGFKDPIPPSRSHEESSAEDESEPGCLHVEGIEICDVEV